MSVIVSLEIGMTMGLIMSFAVLALSAAYRLFSFPDLTIEGSFLFGAVGFAVLAREEQSPVICVAGAVALGAIAGAASGLIHARFKLNKFLTGIIIVAIAYSLSLRMMGGPNIGLFGAAQAMDGRLQTIGFGDLTFGKIAALLLLSLVIGWFFVRLMSTRWGLEWRVAGCNPDHARGLGIPMVVSMVAGLACTNALAALSGYLLAVHQGFADVGLGQGTLIVALASMSVGERLVSEKRLSIPQFVVISSVLGSVVYQTLIAVAVSAGLNPVDLKLVTALLVLAVVALRRKGQQDPMITG